MSWPGGGTHSGATTYMVFEPVAPSITAWILVCPGAQPQTVPSIPTNAISPLSVYHSEVVTGTSKPFASYPFAVNRVQSPASTRLHKIPPLQLTTTLATSPISRTLTGMLF